MASSRGGQSEPLAVCGSVHEARPRAMAAARRPPAVGLERPCRVVGDRVSLKPLGVARLGDLGSRTLRLCAGRKQASMSCRVGVAGAALRAIRGSREPGPWAAT